MKKYKPKYGQGSIEEWLFRPITDEELAADPELHALLITAQDIRDAMKKGWEERIECEPYIRTTYLGKNQLYR